MAVFFTVMPLTDSNSSRSSHTTQTPSEYGLSLLTQNRLNVDMIPSFCSVASMGALFIGEPLSEYSTSPR